MMQDAIGSKKSKKESTSQQVKRDEIVQPHQQRTSSFENIMLPIDLQLLASFASTQLTEGTLLYIDMDRQIMGRAYQESIGQSEVQRFLEKQELEATHIGIYIKYDTLSLFIVLKQINMLIN